MGALSSMSTRVLIAVAHVITTCGIVFALQGGRVNHVRLSHVPSAPHAHPRTHLYYRYKIQFYGPIISMLIYIYIYLNVDFVCFPPADFGAVLPELLAEIEQCSLIAFDTEFTGTYVSLQTVLDSFTADDMYTLWVYPVPIRHVSRSHQTYIVNLVNGCHQIYHPPRHHQIYHPPRHHTCTVYLPGR